MNRTGRKAGSLFASLGLTLIGLLVTGCGPGARKGYRIENGDVVFYSGFPATRAFVEEADAESFITINDNYGKDKSHVFYLTKAIPNADPATFAYLAGSYSKDRNNGYSRDQLISRDGPNFTFVPNPNETPTSVSAEGIAYARDSRRVYNDVMPVDGADPATFVVVPMFNGNYLAHDRRWVYFHNKPMEGVDGATFRKVSDFHFADKQGAWGLVLGRDIFWTPIAGVDVATFSGIEGEYAKDKQRVYIGYNTIADADPATFTVARYLQSRANNGNDSLDPGTVSKK